MAMKKTLLTLLCLCAVIPALAKDYYASMFGINYNGWMLSYRTVS